MSPPGTSELAITDGTIGPASRSNKNGWNHLGGYTMMLEAAYDVSPIKRGDLFYFAHLEKKGALPLGTKVRVGQQIGTVVDTGEGREDVRGKFPPHLHLGWYGTEPEGSRTQLKSGAMNPYPLLLWLEENGGSVSGGTSVPFCEAPQSSESDTNEDSRPVRRSSGQRTDLDAARAGGPRPYGR